MIHIDPARRISPVSPMIYGQFIEHFHRQIYGGVYEPGHPLSDEDGFRTDVIEAMKRIKVPILRWPGGCFVSAYHWKDAVGKERIPSFNKAWRVPEPNTFGTDEYIKFCRKVGCEPYICTNAGTGTPEEMSDWVEYCNMESGTRYSQMRAENGSRDPFGVRYWSIGNENYGSWEIGAKDAKEWGRLVTESAKMMKRTDPSIELSAAALNDMDWNAELLKSCGERLDWISIHGYWDFHQGKNILQDYETCIKYIKDLETPVRRVKGLLNALGCEHIKIAYDEWNLRAWYHPNIMDLYQGLTEEEYLYPRDENDRNSQYTMADAVFSAAFLNMCLRNSDSVAMAGFSPVVNTRGMIYTYQEGIVLRSTYHVFDLYVNEMEDTLADLWSDDEIPDGVDVAATVNSDGSRLAVAAVNTDPDCAKTVRIDTGRSLFRRCKVLTVNGPDKDAYNDIGREEIRCSETVNCDYTNGMEISLQPHSVNVIVIE